LVGEEDTLEALEDGEAGTGDRPEVPTADTLVATTEAFVHSSFSFLISLFFFLFFQLTSIFYVNKTVTIFCLKIKLE
jgi:hypothetical protein